MRDAKRRMSRNSRGRSSKDNSTAVRHACSKMTTDSITQPGTFANTRHRTNTRRSKDMQRSRRRTAEPAHESVRSNVDHSPESSKVRLLAKLCLSQCYGARLCRLRWARRVSEPQTNAIVLFLPSPDWLKAFLHIPSSSFLHKSKKKRL